MKRTNIYQGLKAICKKQIGLLTPNTVVDILVADENKITIGFSIKDKYSEFYLETALFRNDFTIQNTFFRGFEIKPDSKERNTSALNYKSSDSKPHSTNYLYGAIHNLHLGNSFKFKN